jgi:N6-adenosine-specific RNA methylase IME4
MSEPLPAGPYDLILADPPWSYLYWSHKGEGRGAKMHYPTMALDDICALPVAGLAATDAVLLVWATPPQLPQALEVIEAWGFTFKTVAFTWVKLNEDGSPFLGMGFYTRQNAEYCLLATRGAPLPRSDKGVSSVVLSRRRNHSQKPDGQYDRIERLFGRDTRRLELFARRRWPGWDAWGNEAPVEEALMLPLDHAS